MKGPSRILGQEYAEMLGAVLKEKDFLDRAAKTKSRAAEDEKIYTVGLFCITDEIVPANRHISHG